MRRQGLLLAVALVFTLSGASATAATPVNRLASHIDTSDTTTGNGAAQAANVSGDGRYVVYRGYSTNLLTGEQDHSSGGGIIYLYDAATNQDVIVSHAAGSDLQTCTGFAQNPSISLDGRFVVYESNCANLVTGFTDGGGSGTVNVYRYAVADKSNTLISHAAASATTGGNASSYGNDPIGISADGSRVAFLSRATDLLATPLVDTNTGNSGDLYLYQNGAAQLVTHDRTDETVGADDVEPTNVRMDDAGNFITFMSNATTLADVSDNNGSGADVFLYDVATKTNRLVTHRFDSLTAGSTGTHPFAAISGNGKYVVIESKATDLVRDFQDGNTSTGDDIFRYAVSNGAISLVTRAVGTKTTGGDGTSTDPFISTNGTVIAFNSTATNLIASFEKTFLGLPDAFRWSRVRKNGRIVTRTALVSRRLDSAKTTLFGGGRVIGISGNGGKVLWQTSDTQAVAGFVNHNGGNPDLYVYNAGTHRSILVSRQAGTTASGTTGTLAGMNLPARRISTNGSVVGYEANATDLTSPPTTDNDAGGDDAFRFGP